MTPFVTLETVWLVIGFLGQGLFAMRFIYQWIYSERESFGEPRGLPGDELERAAPIATSNPSHPASTERALTVVYQG